MIRPSEERLFSSGWNEHSCFYGSSETYVTRTFTGREQNLLRRHANLFRGVSAQMTSQKEQVEETDETLEFVTECSEEDQFLPNESSACVASLPSFLMQHHKPNIVEPIEPLKNFMINRSREQRAIQDTALLRSYILPVDSSQRRSLYSLDQSDYDPLLDSMETKDPGFFLDYLPLLRGMAVSESLAEYVYETMVSSSKATNDSDAADGFSNRRIHTRRSKKLGFQHYFEKIVPDCVWKDSEHTPKEVGDVLANCSLVYTR